MEQVSLNIGTIGQKLESARQAKGVSVSEAGQDTRILSKFISAMEADDFGVISAPIYAKSFIKMYAKYLGLDANPLVDEYMEQHAPKSKVPLPDEVRQNITKLDSVPMESPNPVSSNGDSKKVFGRIGDTLGQLPASGLSLKMILSVAGAVLLIIIVVSVTQCAGDESEVPAADGAASVERLLIADGVPDTYLVKPGVVDVDKN